MLSWIGKKGQSFFLAPAFMVTSQLKNRGLVHSYVEIVHVSMRMTSKFQRFKFGIGFRRKKNNLWRGKFVDLDSYYWVSISDIIALGNEICFL